MSRTSSIGDTSAAVCLDRPDAMFKIPQEYAGYETTLGSQIFQNALGNYPRSATISSKA